MKILLKILFVAVIVETTLSVSSVKPVNGVSSTTVSIGNDALFQWNIVLENYDQDVGLKLLNGTTELWTQQWGKVSDEGKALFKDRLTVEKSVTYLKATIKNVDFNDSTIELRITGAILDSGFTKLSDIDSTISLIVQALSVSSVKPVNGVSSTTVSIGNDALFQWNIVLENYDQDVGLKLLNGTTELWTQQWGKVSDEGKALFKDRLTVEKSVTYLKATIKNVDFNDSTIELRITGAILDSGFTKLSDIDSTISLIVQGGPFYCGDKLESKYIVGPNARPKFKLCIQSNPAPEISYKFPSSSRASIKGIVTGPSRDNQYTIEFELPPIAAVNCGRELLYTITSPNLQGSIPLTGRSTIILTDIPLDVTISSFSYEKKVPKVVWKEIEAGLCSNKIAYYIETAITKGPVTGTSLLIDDMGQEQTQILMWAEYDSPTGKKIGSKTDFEFNKTTTTSVP
eukprot:TCONS_00037115-protein